MTNEQNESVSEKNCKEKVCEKKDRQYFGIPYPSIYLHTIRLFCPFCRRRGRSKVYKNLWKLRMHFASAHTDSQMTNQDCKNVIGDVDSYIRFSQTLIERGVMK
jgi:hypothetical protein